MDNQQVWLVTGASKGLGLSLIKQLLQAGHKVAATSRNITELTNTSGYIGDNFLPLQVDLTDELSVEKAVSKVITTFSRIDAVVNNAGYGIGGSVEELTDRETRDSFDVNVFGTLNVIRKAVPHLRRQQSGHIINISSIAGITANSGWAVYGAAKYAVIGLSEVLAEDVKSFGIKVTVIAPGAFRTSFLSAESLVITANPIDAYQNVRSSHKKYLQIDGVQAGNPEKAAAAIIAVTKMEQPPVYLLLGSDAYQRAFDKLDRLSATFHEYEELTKSTDY
jgi:NAD(P)-dependent dehydrogenase (short-subunit alcohol dehydrogenase family)